MKKHVAAFLVLMTMASGFSFGWYFTLGGSLVRAGNANHQVDGYAFESRGRSGWGLITSIGWALGGSFRLELEPSLISSKFDVSRSVDTHGRMTATSGLINVFWDFSRGPIRPYLGAGAGISVLTGDLTVQGIPIAMNAAKIVGAWRIGGGIAFDLKKGLALFLGWNYFVIGKTRFEEDLGGEPLFFNSVWNSEYRANVFDIGLRMGI